MHYNRLWRNGTTDRRQRVQAPTCAVSGCGSESFVRDLCKKHYSRWRKAGDPEAPLTRPGGARCDAGNGYVRISGMTGHPIAVKGGKLAEHRKVLFEKIGFGPHWCPHCGEHINWLMPGRGGLTVDHFDYDKKNNAPENLGPSCRPCNTSMARRRTHAMKLDCRAA